MFDGPLVAAGDAAPEHERAFHLHQAGPTGIATLGTARAVGHALGSTPGAKQSRAGFAACLGRSRRDDVECVNHCPQVFTGSAVELSAGASAGDDVLEANEANLAASRTVILVWH